MNNKAAAVAAAAFNFPIFQVVYYNVVKIKLALPLS